MPSLSFCAGGQRARRPARVVDRDERELATEIFHGHSLRPAGACHQSPSRGLIRGARAGKGPGSPFRTCGPAIPFVVVMHAARRIGVVSSGAVTEPGLSRSGGACPPSRDIRRNLGGLRALLRGRFDHLLDARLAECELDAPLVVDPQDHPSTLRIDRDHGAVDPRRPSGPCRSSSGRRSSRAASALAAAAAGP